MDEEQAKKIANHCLRPIVVGDIDIQKYQQVADKIVAQLIIAYRMGVVSGRDEGGER